MMAFDKHHSVSVIVPLYNEIQKLPELYQQLGQFSFEQVIWVDGGSSDGCKEWLEQNVDGKTNTFIVSEKGRAKQMNAGAAMSITSHLLFLHADTLLPTLAVAEINKGLRQSSWGRFDVTFIEKDWRMNIVAWFMNWRSRLSGVATGDQALFVRQAEFQSVGGFPTIPLMEDVEFCKRMKQFDLPYCSRLLVSTSARRWLNNGVIRTVMLMWLFRLAYFLGVNPEKLAKQYQNVR